MHDVVVVGIPLLAILAGILFNRSDSNNLRAELKGEINGLRTELKAEMNGVRGEMNTLRGGLIGEIDSLRTEMRAGFARIDADLRQFFQITGKFEGRIDQISKR